MDLKEAKAKIKIESADAEVNDWVFNHIQMEDDCFGKNFKSTHPECKDCAVLARIDDRLEPINVFCRELVYPGEAASEVPSGEDKEGEVTQMEGDKKESMTALVRRLLGEGKTKEEVTAGVVAAYALEGKDEKWSAGRAKSIIQAVTTGKDKKAAK